MSYRPDPIDTSCVTLPPELLPLIEELARSSHDLWARLRIAEGWTFGPLRDETRKQTPLLIPYEQLPESEKEYDRQLALETIKALIALGYRIERR